MAPHNEAPEPAVDELKRRARRRLVGAVVLALAAAVILPLLLESDPKPLGSDVSIQIPPIDNSKFITPLSPGKDIPAKTAPEARGDAKGEMKATGAEPKPDGGSASPPVPPAATPSRGVVDAERRVLGQGSAQKSTTPATETPASPAVSTTAPLASAEVKPTVEPRQATVSSSAESKPAASEKPQVAADVKSDAKDDKALPSSGGFQIQLAALSDTKAAGELAKKVKASGFSVHTEEVPTRKGSVQRVRVGPFSTRAAADAAVTRLKSLGYGNPQVIAAK